MLSLLRSDLYRLVHGKALWVLTAVLAACMVASAGLLNLASQPEFLVLYAKAESASIDQVREDMAYENSAAGFMSAGGRSGDQEGRGEGAGNGEDAGSASADGAGSGAPGTAASGASDGDVATVGDADSGSAVTLMLTVDDALTAEDFEEVSADMHRFSSPTALFATTFLSAGLLFLAVSLLVAEFFAADFNRRFIRTLPMGRRGRMAYYGEKLLLAALLALYFLLVLMASCAASFAAWGFTYDALNGVGELLLWMLLSWLLTVVYAWLTALVVWLTRSTAAAVVEAVLVSSTFVGAALTQALMYFGAVLPALRAIVSWLPSSTLGPLGQNAAALLAPGPFGAPAAVIALLVLLLWAGGCAALALTVCRRRDV